MVPGSSRIFCTSVTLPDPKPETISTRRQFPSRAHSMLYLLPQFSISPDLQRQSVDPQRFVFHAGVLDNRCSLRAASLAKKISFFLARRAAVEKFRKLLQMLRSRLILR